MFVSTSKEIREEKKKSFLAKKEETGNVDGKPRGFFWLQ